MDIHPVPVCMYVLLYVLLHDVYLSLLYSLFVVRRLIPHGPECGTVSYRYVWSIYLVPGHFKLLGTVVLTQSDDTVQHPYNSYFGPRMLILTFRSKL
jgi:hypothetical protein